MANPDCSECEEAWTNPAGKEDRDYFRRIRSRRVSTGELATSAAILVILAITIFCGNDSPVTPSAAAGMSVSGFTPDACDDVVYSRGEC
jgi:hypothetical protein